MSGMRAQPESDDSLWWLAAAPGIWLGHFLACYLTAAVWCARAAAPSVSLAPVRWAIAGYTVVALAGIVWVGRHGYRRHRRHRCHDAGGTTLPHDADTSEDRHAFLGFATALLAGLAAVATLYQAAVAVFFDSCL